MQLINRIAEELYKDEFNVLLINPPYPRRYGGGIVPPISLCYLAASLRQIGANPALLDLALLLPNYKLDDTYELRELIHTFLEKSSSRSPKLIGIGPLVTASLRSTREIIQACRTSCRATIIVGGPLCAVPGFSTVAKEYLNVDAYVVGDGETPITAIWKAIDTGLNLKSVSPIVAIPGIVEMQPFREQNLDLLPLPARDLLPQDGYQSSRRRSLSSSRMTAAFLSRGCPYSCSFCAAPLASGKAVRKVSTNRITEEVRACVAAGFKTIIFYDDCLFIKSPKLERSVLDFAEAVHKADWDGTFQLELRCDAVASLSDEALSALLGAGCRQINMGIEKAHTTQLQELRKRLSPEIARQACEKIRSTKMRAAGTFIIGGPTENKENIEATIDFAVSLPLDFAHFNPMALYPGTALFDQVFGTSASGSWLELCLDQHIAPQGDILWSNSQIPLDYIMSSIRDAYARFYTEERLQIVLTKHEEGDRESISRSYEILAYDRAHSWIDKGLVPQTDHVGELISC